MHQTERNLATKEISEAQTVYERAGSAQQVLTKQNATSTNRDGNCVSLVDEGEFSTTLWDRRIVRMKGVFLPGSAGDT
jgi:hypothetical protein